MMKIMGLNKLTLLDYPHKMAATIFIGGCNFDCGFCHNFSLLSVDGDEVVSRQEVLDYLEKRKAVLEGVCFSGGEPLLNDLESFILDIKKIKDYKIKIDTNGTSPDRLVYLINKSLVDYVAMDIKNSYNKYEKTIGTKTDFSKILDSIKIIMNLSDYEFRTTLIKEYHTKEDFMQMLKMIEGAKRYTLQAYKNSQDIREKGLSPLEKNEMQEYARLAKNFVDEVIIKD